MSAKLKQREPEWVLRSLPYRDYLNSAWWKERRELYKETVKQQNGKNVLFCEICRRHSFGVATVPWHVHHLNYEHLGAETDDDLLLVCSPCHNLIHFPESHAARYWRKRFLDRLDVDLERIITIAGVR